MVKETKDSMHTYIRIYIRTRARAHTHIHINIYIHREERCQICNTPASRKQNVTDTNEQSCRRLDEVTSLIQR